MSFSDMMESGRGPGVIGTLLALVVLAGFALLYFFVFDEGMQGGAQSIESIIAHQVEEIENIKIGISRSEKALSDLPELQASEKALAKIKRENQSLESSIGGLKQGVAAANDGIAAITREFEAYKDKYRALVRGGAKGRIVPRLETSKGNVYENATLTEVTAIGAQIRHDAGFTRIPYEELPLAMQAEFQFDAKQKAAAIAQEVAARNEHEAAVSAAGIAAEEMVAKQKEKSADENRGKAELEIAKIESQISSLQDEIKQLNRDLDRALYAASSARAAGRSFMDKSGGIQTNIRSKQNRISALRAEVARMRNSL